MFPSGFAKGVFFLFNSLPSPSSAQKHTNKTKYFAGYKLRVWVAICKSNTYLLNLMNLNHRAESHCNSPMRPQRLLVSFVRSLDCLLVCAREVRTPSPPIPPKIQICPFNTRQRQTNKQWKRLLKLVYYLRAEVLQPLARRIPSTVTLTSIRKYVPSLSLRRVRILTPVNDYHHRDSFAGFSTITKLQKYQVLFLDKPTFLRTKQGKLQTVHSHMSTNFSSNREDEIGSQK